MDLPAIDGVQSHLSLPNSFSAADGCADKQSSSEFTDPAELGRSQISDEEPISGGSGALSDFLNQRIVGGKKAGGLDFSRIKRGSDF